VRHGKLDLATDLKIKVTGRELNNLSLNITKFKFQLITLTPFLMSCTCRKRETGWGHSKFFEKYSLLEGVVVPEGPVLALKRAGVMVASRRSIIDIGGAKGCGWGCKHVSRTASLCSHPGNVVSAADSVSVEALLQVEVQVQVLLQVKVAQMPVVVPQQAEQPPAAETAIGTSFSDSYPS
jgi:hypothetical protein